MSATQAGFRGRSRLPPSTWPPSHSLFTRRSRLRRRSPPAGHIRSTPKARGPSFAELAQRASAARDANRIEEAIDLYRQATQIRPKWDAGLWYMGTLLYESDRFEAARAASCNSSN